MNSSRCLLFWCTWCWCWLIYMWREREREMAGCAPTFPNGICNAKLVRRSLIMHSTIRDNRARWCFVSWYDIATCLRDFLVDRLKVVELKLTPRFKLVYPLFRISHFVLSSERNSYNCFLKRKRKNSERFIIFVRQKFRRSKINKLKQEVHFSICLDVNTSGIIIVLFFFFFHLRQYRSKRAV